MEEYQKVRNEVFSLEDKLGVITVVTSCIDGRVKMAKVFKTMVEFLHEMTSPGGIYSLGVRSVGDHIRHAVEYAEGRGLGTLLIGTAHESGRHRDHGCAAMNNDIKKALAGVEIFHRQVKRAFPQVDCIRMCLDTDDDSVGVLDPSGNVAIRVQGRSHVGQEDKDFLEPLQKISTVDSSRTLDDGSIRALAYLLGNAVERQEELFVWPKPERRLFHCERDICFGDGHKWYSPDNLTFHVGEWSLNPADDLLVGLNLVARNIIEGKINMDGGLFVASKGYRKERYRHLAVIEALEYLRFGMDVMRKHKYSDILTRHFVPIAVVVDMNTMEASLVIT
ncbi:MAG TPA: hypothetical protein PLV72_00180 [Candidatus Magasanikbacteria bacterium]|nr:hypothetical protein [Candidatus Magasanikbacteria bacterium]